MTKLRAGHTRNIRYRTSKLIHAGRESYFTKPVRYIAVCLRVMSWHDPVEITDPDPNKVTCKGCLQRIF